MTKQKDNQLYRPPRVSPGGFWLGFKYIALPILLVLGGLDLIFYLIFRYGFNSCYGVLCLL